MSVLSDDEIRALAEARDWSLADDSQWHPLRELVRDAERAVLDRLIAECKQQTKAAGTNSNMARGWGGRAHWLRAKREDKP